MKPFFRNLLAVVCGIAIMWVVGMLIFMGMIGVVAASMDVKPQIPRGSVLVLDFSTFHMDEQSSDIPVGGLSLSADFGTATIGLWDAVDAITTAALDDDISAIYVKPDGGDAGLADYEEIRAALSLFRQSGKPVIVYLQNGTHAGLYLGSAADKVFMTSDHGGTSMFIGLSAQLLFLKDLLDKLGVHVQLIRHGKYKSAGEMFIRNASSPENREQYEAYVRSMWETLSVSIATGRGVAIEDLNELVDGLKLNLPEDFLAAGLVDGLMDKNAMTDYLCKIAGVGSSKDLSLISFPQYIDARDLSDVRKGHKVAILFANGEIADGAAEAGVITGDYYADMINEIRLDDSIKAVVLRVNSPGGSVLASSKVKDALEMLCAAKPVVASYGNYAASGGYWISCGCQEIYADDTTLTGSIGVFSMIPEFSATAKNLLHVGVETVGSNRHSDMFSLMRPFDAEELAFMQASVEDIYERFVGLVADGRGLTTDYVDSIAQGRVWTGTQAVGLGLVDHIGTLQDAVYRAVTLSGGEEDPMQWQVVQYPAKATMEELLATLLSNQQYEVPTVRLLENTPFAALESAFDALTVKDPTRVYARLPYSIVVK